MGISVHARRPGGRFAVRPASALAVLAAMFAAGPRWPARLRPLQVQRGAALLPLVAILLTGCMWGPAHADTGVIAAMALSDPSPGSAIDIVALLQQVPWVGPYLPDILTIIGIASMIAAHLPPPTSSTGWYAMLWAVLRWVANNFRYATPAAKPAAAPKVPPAGMAILCLMLAGGTLSACGDYQTTVAQVQVAYTATERLATKYIQLPPCPTAQLCSDADVIAKIKAADNVAYAAVKSAKAGKLSPAEAMAAVAGLAVLIPANDR